MRLADWKRIEHADGEYCSYRAPTVALLRRYLRMAADAGRIPSLMGREFFRTTHVAYSDQNFEDLVNFVIDVERCLETLPPQAQAVIVCVVFHEYSQDEAADRLGINLRTLNRRLADSIDLLSHVFLQRRMLVQIDDALRATAVRLRGSTARNCGIVPFRDFLLRCRGLPASVKKFVKSTKNQNVA